MDDTQKKWIDDASYERLLERWRNAPPGDSIFIGDAGNYYKKIMNEKRDNCDHLAISMKVGWGGPSA
jgi:hypothetical protein